MPVPGRMPGFFSQPVEMAGQPMAGAGAQLGLILLQHPKCRSILAGPYSAGTLFPQRAGLEREDFASADHPPARRSSFDQIRIGSFDARGVPGWETEAFGSASNWLTRQKGAKARDGE
jgi:hypothetical protein